MSCTKENIQAGKSEVGEIIRYCRNSQHLTQEEFAERINMTARAVSNIENGKSDLKLSTLIRISRALDITVVELLTYPQILNQNDEE